MIVLTYPQAAMLLHLVATAIILFKVFKPHIYEPSSGLVPDRGLNTGIVLLLSIFFCHVPLLLILWTGDFWAGYSEPAPVPPPEPEVEVAI